MKMKRSIVLLMAACMAFGQVVYAQEDAKEAVQAEQVKPEEDITGQEEDNAGQEENTAGSQDDAAAPEEQNPDRDEEMQDVPVEEQKTPAEEQPEEKKTGEEETEKQAEPEKREETIDAASLSLDFEVETAEQKLYQDMPILLMTNFTYSAEENPYTVISDDETICQASVKSGAYYRDTHKVILEMAGIKPGTTTVHLQLADTECATYKVTVKECPKDAANIADMTLRSVLLEEYGGCDTNQDAYISTEELKQCQLVNCPMELADAKSIESIEAMKYAENLSYVSLKGNKELKNIDVLFQMKQLTHVALDGTGVSVADKWKLADFKDLTIGKGGKITLPKIQGCLDEDTFSITMSGDGQLIDLEKKEWDKEYHILAKAAGSVKLSVQYEDQFKEITLQIDGMEADQQVNGKYDGKAEIVEDVVTTIENSNGELWKTYPEIEKLPADTKKYVAAFVYSCGAGKESVEYRLDHNNVLWNGEKKIAEDIQSFDGHYALNAKGELLNIFNVDGERVEQVQSWVSAIEGGETVNGYLLKQDGTLWTRKERASAEKPDAWVQIDENVKQLVRWGYRKEDGMVIAFDGVECPQKAKYLTAKEGLQGIDGYMGMDGRFYMKSYREIIMLGSIPAKDYTYWAYKGYILTDNEDVYVYDIETGKLSFLAHEAARLNHSGGSWCYQLKDGTYIGYDMQEEKTAVVKEIEIFSNSFSDVYRLCINEGGTILQKNGIDLLNHVRDIWKSGKSGKNCYALRTDGTIWNVTSVPTEITSICPADYKKGDVNEDGNVDIQDLRIVLQGVCEKITLTQRQIVIADVTADGKVDIQDLRKELRFVCGKISEL